MAHRNMGAGYQGMMPTVPESKAAQHPTNQIHVDFLLQRCKVAVEAKRPQAFTLLKAMATIASHPDPLTTEAQLLAVKGIGSKTAPHIFRNYEKQTGVVREAGVNPYANVPAHLPPRKRGRTSAEGNADENAAESTPAPTSKKFSLLVAMGKHPKEKAFQISDICRIANKVREDRGLLSCSPALWRTECLALAKLGMIQRTMGEERVEILRLSERGRKVASATITKHYGELHQSTMLAFTTSSSSSSRNVIKGDSRVTVSSNSTQDGQLIELDSDDDAPSIVIRGGSQHVSATTQVNAVTTSHAAKTPHQRAEKRADNKRRSPFHFNGQSSSETTPRFQGHAIGAAERENCPWELVLLVDEREKVHRDARYEFQHHLCGMGVTVETRSLPLGDFLWIFRNKISKKEVVSDFIIERKCADDLACSIRDGRYKEQKFRLHDCGLGRIIYLVEGSACSQSSLTPQALETAMTETQVRDGFSLRQTATPAETGQFLANLHELIQSLTTHSDTRPAWDGPDISPSREYTNFYNKNGKRKLTTVKEVFGAQIKQINGCSGSVANSVLERYPTPRKMFMCYESELASACAESRMLHFSDILPAGHMNRVGKALSCRLHDVFSMP